MPATDYYPQMPAGPPPKGRGPPPPDKDREEDGDYETFLVAKSALGGREVRPGETITMRVEHVYDDEVEMCTAKSKPKEPEGPPSADEELDMMGQEGE